GVAGVEPSQVQVELAVRKAMSDPVRPVDRQRRLANARGASDRGDDDRGVCFIAGPGWGTIARRGRGIAYEGVEAPQLRHPPDETAHVHRQLGRHGRRATHRTPGADLARIAWML